MPSDLPALCPRQEAGTRLEYDHQGHIKSQATAPRAPGTTVVLKELFKTLPVRYKEFHRNLKRDYGKMLALLQAYALICRSVRLVVTHAVGHAPRSTVVHTQGAGTLRDNIITVLGAKAVAGLQPFEAALPHGCTASGFVSLPAAGAGRASGDRQFLYVNGRPVDLPRVAKTLNEAYRAFNATQLPAAVLDFRLPTDSYDVNVTPDKRRIMLHAEEELLAALHAALLATWAPSMETFAVGGAAATDARPKGGRGTKRARAGADSGEEREWSSADDTSDDDDGDAAPAAALSGDGDRVQSEAHDVAQAPADARLGTLFTPTPRETASLPAAAPARGSAEGLSGRRAGATRVSATHGVQTSIERFTAPLPPAADLDADAMLPPGGDVTQQQTAVEAAALALDAPLTDAPASQRNQATPAYAAGIERGSRTLTFDMTAIQARVCALCACRVT